MIWPEVWPFALAVVFSRWRVQEWADKTMFVVGDYEAHARYCACMDCQSGRGGTHLRPPHGGRNK
jgi:hypothetical protein